MMGVCLDVDPAVPILTKSQRMQSIDFKKGLLTYCRGYQMECKSSYRPTSPCKDRFVRPWNK